MAGYVPWPYPADGAERFIVDCALPAMAAGRQWHWALRRRAAPERTIGVITLMDGDGDGDNRGFWLDPVWQGQGLMREACEVVTDYWFDVLERPMLRMAKAVANTRSRGFSEKIGMRHVATEMRDLVGGREVCEIWEMTREEWAARAR